MNYVIRRVGGRDCRVVHMDRLQSYVETALFVPDTGGRRYYTSLGYLLAEQVRRRLPPKIRMADSIQDVGTIASPSEPEVISDDDDPQTDGIARKRR